MACPWGTPGRVRGDELEGRGGEALVDSSDDGSGLGSLSSTPAAEPLCRALQEATVGTGSNQRGTPHINWNRFQPTWPPAHRLEPVPTNVALRTSIGTGSKQRGTPHIGWNRFQPTWPPAHRDRFRGRGERRIEPAPTLVAIGRLEPGRAVQAIRASEPVPTEPGSQGGVALVDGRGRDTRLGPASCAPTPSIEMGAIAPPVGVRSTGHAAGYPATLPVNPATAADLRDRARSRHG
jgi:hypothetical protein